VGLTAHAETKPCLCALRQDDRGQNFRAAACCATWSTLFDLRIHREHDAASRLLQVANEVRTQVALAPAAEFNRFAHSFSHIFDGAYAAGYYSYSWAEVLSADVWSAFEESGVFDPERVAAIARQPRSRWQPQRVDLQGLPWARTAHRCAAAARACLTRQTVSTNAQLAGPDARCHEPNVPAHPRKPCAASGIGHGLPGRRQRHSTRWSAGRPHHPHRPAPSDAGARVSTFSAAAV
jgi:hypothetical protein